VSAFIAPCLPSPTDRLPRGAGWVHEIKRDGFRLMVRRDAAGVRLITRNGHDWSGRFPLIGDAAGQPPLKCSESPVAALSEKEGYEPRRVMNGSASGPSRIARP
jgi:hypothetical protein